MLTRFPRRLVMVLIYLIGVVGLSGFVWWTAEGRALEQLKQAGQADLTLAGDSLKNELDTFRSLAVVVAASPDVERVLTDGTEVGQVDFLLELAGKAGALDILVVGRTGRELATASVGANETHADRPYFTRATHGALGVYHLLSERYDRRVYLFAAPVFAENGPVLGAVIVAADVEAVEANWRGSRPTVFFTDELGVVFVSSRTELLLRSRTGDVRGAAQSAEYPSGVVSALPEIETRMVRGGHEIWQMNGGRYLPDRGLHLTREMPVIGLTGEGLFDLAPVRQLALLQAAVAGALALAFGAFVFWATERRRTLAEANTRLEARVAARTAELQDANANLRREVSERRDAQARLQQAQADLVEAGKLSALGQMSAGISHELNQPLMAIRSFAENAETFLDKGRPEVAAKNLSRINDLARRMGRIIKNLRAFARQESEGVRDVDMVGVVDGVLEMVGPRLQSEEIALHWQRPLEAMIVKGGDVRLQQVVANLVVNGIDAMDGTDDRALYLSLAQNEGRVMLTVRDTGPGLKDPEKVFEPFYSTKQMPSKEGLGLGLSISYGLVQSFGGEIRGRNHPDGGAVFTVSLGASPAQVAA